MKIKQLEECDEAQRYNRERWWISNTPDTLNKKMPQPPEMSQKTPEGKKVYMEQYRKDNAEALRKYDAERRASPEVKAAAAAQHKVWAAANKEAIKANKQSVIVCDKCDQEVTKSNKWRHDAKCAENMAKETARQMLRVKAAELRGSGISQREIAIALETSRPTIQLLLQEYDAMT